MNVVLFSFRVCIECGYGPNSYISLQLGHQRCSHFTCALSVSLALFYPNSVQTFLLFSQNCNLTNSNHFRYVMALALFVILMKKVDLVPPSMKDLQIFRFLRNGMMEGIKIAC